MSTTTIVCNKCKTEICKVATKITSGSDEGFKKFASSTDEGFKLAISPGSGATFQCGCGSGITMKCEKDG